MFRGMITGITFNRSRMREACIGGFLEATDVADYLVRKGMPFREAHGVAARIVRSCIESGKRTIAECPLETLREHSALFAEDLYPALMPEAQAGARSLPGGPAPEAVRKQIAALRSSV
jgi:argininosuccinate lyase